MDRVGAVAAGVIEDAVAHVEVLPDRVYGLLCARQDYETEDQHTPLSIGSDEARFYQTYNTDYPQCIHFRKKGDKLLLCANQNKKDASYIDDEKASIMQEYTAADWDRAISIVPIGICSPLRNDMRRPLLTGIVTTCFCQPPESLPSQQVTLFGDKFSTDRLRERKTMSQTMFMEKNT